MRSGAVLQSASGIQLIYELRESTRMSDNAVLILNLESGASRP